MGNKNTQMVEIAAEKLYKLTLSANRDSAKEQGFYDGRFGSRIEPDKKKGQHLKLRRDKHNLKRI